MTITTRNLTIALAVGLLAGAGIFALSNSRSTASPEATETVATTTQGDVATTTETAGATLSAEKALEILNVQKYVADARALKNTGNYDAAIAKLNQGLAVFPGDVVMLNNLGDIYMNFKKDYVKADVAYKGVIKTDARYLDAYRHLFELYTTTTYKPSNTAAADIVAQALKAVPTAYDLQFMLARYYKDIGDNSNARVQYAAAISNAKGQNLTTVAAQMQAELDGLPQ